MNKMKTLSFTALAFLALQGNAATWCIMDNIERVDTAGNLGKGCWVSGTFSAESGARYIEDINLCGHTDIDVNGRNFSIALTAFTANKKLQFYFENYDSCSQVRARWEHEFGRMSMID